MTEWSGLKYNTTKFWKNYTTKKVRINRAEKISKFEVISKLFSILKAVKLSNINVYRMKQCND